MNRYHRTSWDKPVSPDVDTTDCMDGISPAFRSMKAQYADEATEARYYAWLRTQPKWPNIRQEEWDNLLNGNPDDMAVQFIMFEKFLAVDPNPTFRDEVASQERK